MFGDNPGTSEYIEMTEPSHLFTQFTDFPGFIEYSQMHLPIMMLNFFR